VVSGDLPSALPPSFRAERTADELRALAGQLRSLTNQVEQAAAQNNEEAAAAAAASEAARIVSADAHNAAELVLFDQLMAVTDYREVLTDQLDTALLSRFRVSRSMRSWIDPILAGRGVSEADVAVGIQMLVLLMLALVSHREIRLAKGKYQYGDIQTVEHLRKEPRGEEPDEEEYEYEAEYNDVYNAWDEWKPQWRDGVSIIGQDGVMLAGSAARLTVEADDVRF